VSDAFGQKFSSSPELVENCPHGNLFAMEIDPEVKMGEQNDELKEMLRQQQEAGQGGGQQQGNMLESLLGMDVKDISQSIPGLDEAMSFAEVLKMVKSMEFSCVIFDTAPTGHTLRFLAFPSMMQKTLGKFLGMRDKMGGMFSTMMSMLGGPQGPGTENALFDKLEEQMKTIEDVNEQFEDPELTTFVCVCIPEFLSVYETERLIQALTKYGIDCMAIIVNQVLFPPDDSSCELCHSRENMQKKYLDQIDMLYDEFHVVRMPLLNMEVRGIPSLLKFGNWQVQPFDPKKDSRKLDSDDRT
jgi:arsenite-transporting ATPase